MLRFGSLHDRVDRYRRINRRDMITRTIYVPWYMTSALSPQERERRSDRSEISFDGIRNSTVVVNISPWYEEFRYSGVV